MTGKSRKRDNYLKYSGLVFQLVGIILMSLFLGGWLDDKFNNETPYITIILVFLLFGAFMFKLSKELK